jgi:hypothetical protein
VSGVLYLWLIGACMLVVFMVALVIISIWRGRLPLLSDVVVVLVAVAAVGLFFLLMSYGPIEGAAPLVDRAVQR